MPFRLSFLSFSFICLLLCITTVQGQRKSKKSEVLPDKVSLYTQPKLMVGIVVDQMRYDYLTRYWNRFQDGGFKRLVNGGFNCKNNHYNYAPTSTGPGHASIYTGTTPSVHGVIGNNWYDKLSGESVYCAGDPAYNTIGSSSEAGKMSPGRMLVSTVTDQLRLHSQMRSKVISIALKDRGAVLPGGHTANAAYWFEGGKDGRWISSSYYMNKLPDWVQTFNQAGSVSQYKKAWTTLEDINSYVESGPDNTKYEGVFKEEKAPIFPHNLDEIWNANGDYNILRSTPYGNSITTDFALAAIEAENLGKDQITDFLAISYSSTDYVGHKYGVNSKEVQDTYMRLDGELIRLLDYLDEGVGEGNYTVFLTADHGAVHVPAFLEDNKIPAGYLNKQTAIKSLKENIKYTYGAAELIRNVSNNQIFLDHMVIKNLDLSLQEVQSSLAEELLKQGHYRNVYTAYQLQNGEFTKGLPYILQNGYNRMRSGDIMLVPNTGYIDYSKTGSTHGSSNIYDTHVPLILYGKGILQGATIERTEITDIAPTIAVLLGIAFPNGSTGEPVVKALE
ncbi:alkaline phosphatase PafA [Eudoraea chungangensis]|uniref:alkaline phosphatase PafA n=1 Tax=Eudoraea chungangensis TaxID=1481905 RepID=UPI0030B9BA74